jgi:hypothetical protein
MAQKMFEENYALFMEKFPQLALEIPASEKPAPSSKTLRTVSLKNKDVFYFYGIGQGEGYKMAADWLHEQPSRRLIFLERDLMSLSKFLHLEEAAKILSDEQVTIAHPEAIDALVEQFSAAAIEIAAPKKIRDELLKKNAFAYALHLDRLHGHYLFHNFIQNIKRLPASFYANKLAGKFQNIPAVICGAGPSLKQAIPTLKTFENKALLLAGGSTLAALSSEGIMPHFGMAVDPNPEEYRRFKNSFAFEVPLLYSTRVIPELFQTANGPFGYMRAGIGGALELWMEEQLGLLDPLIGNELTNNAISVTSMCLAWAVFLGCNPIVLCGMDLAYTNNQRYAPGVSSDAVDLKEEGSAADRTIKSKDREGKPIYTAVRWLMESQAFSHFAKKHPKTTFWNTTEGGIGFKNIPYRPLSEVCLPNLAFPLRAKVHEAISLAPMPKNTQEVIDKNLLALRESLDRVVHYLEICSGQKPGSKTLAEFELGEEIAHLYLFYDAKRVVSKGFHGSETEKWERFLLLAKEYQLKLA